MLRSVACCALWLLIGSASPQAAAQALRPFPLAPAADGTLVATPGALEDLARHERLRLVDVTLPGSGPLVLDLSRVPLAADGATWLVDGVVEPFGISETLVRAEGTVIHAGTLLDRPGRAPRRGPARAGPL